MRLPTIAIMFSLTLANAASAQAMDGHHDEAAAPGQARPGTAIALTEGEVRNVDDRAHTITLKHGRLDNLNMAPMTMVYRVREPALLANVRVGQKVRFAVDRVDGDLTVVALEIVQ